VWAPGDQRFKVVAPDQEQVIVDYAEAREGRGRWLSSSTSCTSASEDARCTPWTPSSRPTSGGPVDLRGAALHGNRPPACRDSESPASVLPRTKHGGDYEGVFYGSASTSPPYVMAQMGHTTPNLTLTIYARQIDRRDGEPDRLKALVEGANWYRTGIEAAQTTAHGARAVPSEPVNSGNVPE
jgi:hypothetical protein